MKFKVPGFVKRRIVRLAQAIRKSGDPKVVARGMALGVAAAFLMPIGIHTVSVVLLGIVLKCNKVVALTATFCIANELFIPGLYTLQCFLGSYILFEPLSWHEIHSIMCSFGHHHSFEKSLEMLWQFLHFYLIGGLALCLVTVYPAYRLGFVLARKLQLTPRRPGEPPRPQNLP